MELSHSALKNFYDKQADKALYWRKRNAYYHEQLENFLRFVIPKNKNVLEIGSGVGATLAGLMPKRGVGVDISPQMVQTAQRAYPDLEFRVHETDKIPVSETFDYILLSDLIGHLPDVQTTLESLHGVANKESRIVITYHNHLWEWILKLVEKLRLKMPQPMQNWLSRRDIINILNLSNFEVVKSGSILLMPVYVPLISRFCNQYLARLPILRHFCVVEYVIARQRPQVSTREYSVSVVIPARNEAGNIEAAVTRLPDLGNHTEIIFVEGGSKDNTKDEIARVVEKYPHKNIIAMDQGDGVGKGDAVRKGFAKASGDIVMILDADLTVPPEDLPKFYQALKNGIGEFIMGTRLVYPMQDEAMRFLNVLGNKFFSSAFSWLLDQPLKDTLCGTKVMFRSDYEELARNRHYFGDFDPFGDFDLIFGAAKLNLKIVEIPIRYEARTYGTTNISRFRHGWLLLKMTVFAARKIKFF